MDPITWLVLAGIILCAAALVYATFALGRRADEQSDELARSLGIREE